MAKKESFPIAIKSGSAVVKIYSTPTKGCHSFTLSYWIGKKRMRPTFSDLEKAKAEARRIVAELGSGEFTESALDREARASYARALELLPAGVPLELAVSQFSEASKIIGGRSIVEAARFYARRHPAELPRRTVSEVVEELIVAKTEDGLSYLAINDLKKLRILAKDFAVQISDLNGTDVDEWLRGRKLAGRTRNNYRDLVRSMFNFAKGKKYLPFDHDEISGIAIAKEGSSEIEIFTPVEMQMILGYADPHLVPFLALAAFSGIRHWELTRLDWGDIKFDAGHIELKQGKTKTRNRRLVPIQPNLRKWLEPHAKPFGPVKSHANMSEELMYLARKIVTEEKEKDGPFKAFKWKHNALRHSFISYRMAILKDENAVALESGNSPKVIFESYRELVSAGDAEKWFRIVPAESETIIIAPQFAAK